MDAPGSLKQVTNKEKRVQAATPKRPINQVAGGSASMVIMPKNAKSPPHLEDFVSNFYRKHMHTPRESKHMHT